MYSYTFVLIGTIARSDIRYRGSCRDIRPDSP